MFVADRRGRQAAAEERLYSRRKEDLRDVERCIARTETMEHGRILEAHCVFLAQHGRVPRERTRRGRELVVMAYSESDLAAWAKQVDVLRREASRLRALQAKHRSERRERWKQHRQREKKRRVEAAQRCERVGGDDRVAFTIPRRKKRKVA